MESFIYNPKYFPATGTTYTPLFHVADWFPTLLEISGVAYSPIDEYAVDGVSHYQSLLGKVGRLVGFAAVVRVWGQWCGLSHRL